MANPIPKAIKKDLKNILQIDLTNDVKNIYAFGDFMGIDYKVLISFTCNQSTIAKIIAVKKMKLITNDGGLSFSDELSWWDQQKIDKLDGYKVGKEYEYWEYLWYDKKTNTAWYEEFSL
jgi:hypothetical protein